MKLTKNQKIFLDVVVEGKWSLNHETSLVDVDGKVIIPNNYIKNGKLPVKFGEVTSKFSCENNEMVSLEGVSHTVGGNFSCWNNQLVSLKGAPHKVGGDFHCQNNQIVSLEGAPHTVGGDFHCWNNKLISLEGAPHKVGGYFHIDLPDENSEYYDKVISHLIALIDSGVVKDKDYYQSKIDAWFNKQILIELN